MTVFEQMAALADELYFGSLEKVQAHKSAGRRRMAAREARNTREFAKFRRSAQYWLQRNNARMAA